MKEYELKKSHARCEAKLELVYRGRKLKESGHRSARGGDNMAKVQHKCCGGEIVEELGYKAVQLKCQECGKVWSVTSDFSDIEVPGFLSTKNVKNAGVFIKFKKPVRNPIVNFMFNERLRRIAAMVDCSFNRKCIVLDLGCAEGYFTQWLAQRINGMVIGVDASRRACIRAKLRAHYGTLASHAVMEIVHADITRLPFREGSIDAVVCASVLEHVKNLEGAVKQIRDSVKKGGILIAGYPIETMVFLAIFRLLASLPLHRDLGKCVRDPRIFGKNAFMKSPETHKQTFQTIRALLQKHFLILKKEKCFFTIFPDLMSYYECAKMVKRSMNH